MDILSLAWVYILGSKFTSACIPYPRGQPLPILENILLLQGVWKQAWVSHQGLFSTAELWEFPIEKHEDNADLECHERAKENSNWVFIEGYRFWLLQKTARGQSGLSGVNWVRTVLMLISNDFHTTTKNKNFQVTSEWALH